MTQQTTNLSTTGSPMDAEVAAILEEEQASINETSSIKLNRTMSPKDKDLTKAYDPTKLPDAWQIYEELKAEMDAKLIADATEVIKIKLLEMRTCQFIAQDQAAGQLERDNALNRLDRLVPELQNLLDFPLEEIAMKKDHSQV